MYWSVVCIIEQNHVQFPFEILLESSSGISRICPLSLLFMGDISSLNFFLLFLQAYAKFSGAKLTIQPVDWTWKTLTGSLAVNLENCCWLALQP